jgi:hypothetical protein
MQGSTAGYLPGLPDNEVVADILVYLAEWAGQHFVPVGEIVYQAVHFSDISDGGFLDQ